ncbi:MAG TPA: hypothetical protein VMV49_11595 [Candidatus Deferrimicrobium sp.]|nr:hypothetical protein [Candidatus Deferrimicrobium sp.]
MRFKKEKEEITLEEIYREAREKEGPVIIPPQINHDYWQKLQTLVSTAAFGELLKEFLTYKQKAEENPGEFIEGNPILGAPFEGYYKPSEEEKRLSEIGMAIGLVIQSCHLQEECKKFLKEINKEQSLEIIEFIQYNFYYVDVVGSGRFIYPYKGIPLKISLKKRLEEILKSL